MLLWIMRLNSRFEILKLSRFMHMNMNMCMSISWSAILCPIYELKLEMEACTTTQKNKMKWIVFRLSTGNLMRARVFDLKSIDNAQVELLCKVEILHFVYECVRACVRVCVYAWCAPNVISKKQSEKWRQKKKIIVIDKQKYRQLGIGQLSKSNIMQYTTLVEMFGYLSTGHSRLFRVFI